MVPLVTRERFSVANVTIGVHVTIGGNVGTNGTIGSPNRTIGKPIGVNSNKMINISNLLLYFHFLCIYFSISIICKYNPDKNNAYLGNL